MRTSLLASLTTLLAGSGLALAQPPAPSGTVDWEPAQPAVSPETAGTEANDAPPDMPAAPSPVEPWRNFGQFPWKEPSPAKKMDEDPDRSPFHVWASGEYLIWWLKDAPVPVPLLTTGPTDSGGQLDANGTSVVLGNSNINLGTTSGGRVTAGCYVDCILLSLEGGAFLLERSGGGQSAHSDANGNPLLARPLTNVFSGQETSILVASPGAFAGSLNVASSAQLWGAEMNLDCHVFHNQCLSVDLLAGMRYLDLLEDLNITQSTQVLPGGVGSFQGNTLEAPASLGIGDHFSTRNQFYGGQVGAQAEVQVSRLFAYLFTKVAFGPNHEAVSISGGTSASSSTISGTAPGGVLALSSNSGHFSHDQFAIVPEAGINLGIQLTSFMRLYGGYTFLYCSDVVRPGDQISRTIDPTLVPVNSTFGGASGTRTPFAAERSDFWVHGVNLGVAFRY